MLPVLQSLLNQIAKRSNNMILSKVSTGVWFQLIRKLSVLRIEHFSTWLYVIFWT